MITTHPSAKTGEAQVRKQHPAVMTADITQRTVLFFTLIGMSPRRRSLKLLEIQHSLQAKRASWN